MLSGQAARVARAKTQKMDILSSQGGEQYCIRGASGSIYHVRCSNGRLKCNCPDALAQRSIACKHCCLVAMNTMTSWQQLVFFSSGRIERRTEEPSARNAECPCCYEALTGGTRVCPQCAHGFHDRCLNTWLSKATSCPCCRGTMISHPRCPVRVS